MAIDKIHTILNFTGIAIGDTQTLPHGLVLRGAPLLPDFVFLQFQDTFELVSATTTDVTIRNTANTGGDCEAYVFCLHPAIRLLGLAPDDGTMQQGLTPRPFCPGSPNSGAGGGGAFDVVVFRPGGVASENVVTTWDDALSLLAQLEGTRYLEFDDSITTPIVIPTPTVPGTPYPMEGVVWATVPDRVVTVTVPEGVSFTGLRSFNDRIQITFSGTTPPVSDFVNAAPQLETVTLSNGALIRTSGGAAFFSIDADAQILLGAEGGFTSGTEVVDIATGNTVSIFSLGAQAILSDDTIAGAVGATLNLVRANDAPFSFSDVQTAFLGTLNLTNTTRDFTYPTAVLTGNLALGDASQLVLVDPTGGPFAVTLPPAAAHRGESITVKNTTASVNNVTLTAGGGDNIDGSASMVMSGDHFFVRLTSDGANAWYVTAA